MRVLDTADVKDVTALAFSPDGRRLACAAYLRGVVLHDLSDGNSAVRVGPDGFRWTVVVGFEQSGELVTVTTEGRTRFDPTTGTRLGIGPHDDGGPQPVAYFDTSLNGTRLATVQLWHPRSRLICWDAVGDSWNRRWHVDDLTAHCPLAMSPTGDLVAVFAETALNRLNSHQLLVLDTETGDPLGAGAYPYHLLHGPRFRPDGRQVVVPHEASLVVWDVRRLGKPVVVKNDSRKHFTAAAYHPSGRYLFTTSNDATVTVWDADNWVRVKRFDWDIGRLRSVAVSADGLLAAAGSDRGRVVVWDVDV